MDLLKIYGNVNENGFGDLSQPHVPPFLWNTIIAIVKQLLVH